MKTSQLRPSHSHHINIPELYFLACAGDEIFQDAYIITAKSKYVDMAFDIAGRNRDVVTDTNFMEAAARIINHQDYSVHESVEVKSDGISVCINSESINEEAETKALNMVVEALRQLDGKHGVIYFGPPLHFSTTELPFFFQH